MLKSANNLKAIFFLVLIAYATLILTGYKRYVVWDQIVDHYKDELNHISTDYYCKTKMEIALRSENKIIKLVQLSDEQLSQKCNTIGGSNIENSRFNENDFNRTSHFHRVRLMIMKPIVETALLTGLNIHSLFTFVCIILIFAMSLLLSMKSFKLNFNKFRLFSAAMICVSIAMNGRNLFSFLGLSFLLYSMTIPTMNSSKNRLVFWTSVGLAMLFSNVSSGINTYILVFFIIWLWMNQKIFIPFGLVDYLLLTAILIGQSYWVLTGLFKNISFYGDNIFLSPFLMLNHGFGKHLFAPESLALALILGLFYYNYKEKIHSRRKNLNSFQLTYIMGSSLCLVAGLFGYSILSLSIVFSLLLGSDLTLSSFNQK
jgi:hypothetical protein